MTDRETLLAYNPHTSEVRIGPLLAEGDHDWTEHPIRYHMTGGAAYHHIRAMTGDRLRAMVFTDFYTLVVRDGIPWAAAHREFLKVDEYRRGISPDIEGAEH